MQPLAPLWCRVLTVLAVGLGYFFDNIPLTFLSRRLYLLAPSSQMKRSRQRYCLKLSMSTVPLRVTEWHLFLLVVSALTSWFLSDWQLGLCYSRWTATRTGDYSVWAGPQLNVLGMYGLSSEALVGKSVSFFMVYTCVSLHSIIWAELLVK